LTLIRDMNYSYMSSLPSRFRNAVLEGCPDVLLDDAERLTYKYLSNKDRVYGHFLNDFIYREIQDDLKVVAIAGSVGVGKTHLMCASANLIRCHDFRSIFLWRDLSYDLFKRLEVRKSEFIDLLMEYGFLFIDDVKFDAGDNLQAELFTELILKLYDHDRHPGLIFTHNWDDTGGDIKDFWLERLPEYVADRFLNMTAFLKMTDGSKREDR